MFKPNNQSGTGRLPGKTNSRDESIKRMFQLMLESMMEGERTAFLGYGKHDFSGYGTPNSRNGYYKRDLLTGLGNLEKILIPRDREGEFSPELIDKWERATKPMDNLVLELYAKGMSTRDIGSVIEKIYGKRISPQTVTLVTKEVEKEALAWRTRPLKKRYTAIFADALVVKIRRDVVDNDAVYALCGIDSQGYRDILGLYVGAQESAGYWEEILRDIKDRGVEEVLLFVTDGLTGMEAVIEKVFPKAMHQRCVVHQVRSSLNKVRPRHKEAIAQDFKKIYRSRTIQEAKTHLLELQQNWEKFYPSVVRGWITNFNSLMQFLEFPEGVRSQLYTTNWIERLNKEFRKVLKNKNSLPTENSVYLLLYLKIRDVVSSWEGKRLNGFVACNVDIQLLWEKYYPRSKRGFTQDG